MNDVQVGRYSALLHKLLDMGEGAPTPTLAPELFAMLGLEVDRPEWGWLKQEYRAAAYYLDGAGVGARSQVALINPTGSGVLAVIEEIKAACTSEMVILTQSMGTTLTTAGFSSVAAGRVIDLRAGVNGLGYNKIATCALYSATMAIQGLSFHRLFCFSKGSTLHTFKFDRPIVLPPNTAVNVSGSADNVDLYASMVWRERPIEKMELQGVNPRLV